MISSPESPTAAAADPATEGDGRADVIQMLVSLTRRCVDLLDVQSAGVLLSDDHGGLQMIAATTEQTRRLGLAQIQRGAGPWVESYATGLAVWHHDLGTAGDLWPDFAPLAARAGVCWVHAEPVRSRTAVTGTLGLFRTAPAASLPVDGHMTRVLADLIGLLVSQDLAMRTMPVHAGRLRQAMTTRRAIEQARGMVAQHAGIGLDEASRCLSEHARASSRRVSAVAEDVVAGALPLAEVAARTQGHEPT